MMIKKTTYMKSQTTRIKGKYRNNYNDTNKNINKETNKQIIKQTIENLLKRYQSLMRKILVLHLAIFFVLSSLVFHVYIDDLILQVKKNVFGHNKTCPVSSSLQYKIRNITQYVYCTFSLAMFSVI